MSLATTERARLAELFRALGPNAPTCCEGWTTKDLLVHLLVRENHPVAAAGMFVPFAKSQLEQRTADYKRRDFNELLAVWSTGPVGSFNLMKVADRFANASEHFVHHEDVRRAQDDWEPRELSAEENAELNKVLTMMAPLLLRTSTRPLVLHPEGGSRMVVADRRGISESGDDVVHIHGAPGELLLLAFDRPYKNVRIEGDPSHIVTSSV